MVSSHCRPELYSCPSWQARACRAKHVSQITGGTPNQRYRRRTARQLKHLAYRLGCRRQGARTRIKLGNSPKMHPRRATAYQANLGTRAEACGSLSLGRGTDLQPGAFRFFLSCRSEDAILLRSSLPHARQTRDTFLWFAGELSTCGFLASLHWLIPTEGPPLAARLL